MILLDSKNNEIIIESSPFARGGEGIIYKVVQSPYQDCCVKYFHKGKMDTRIGKIDYMIKHQLAAPVNSQYRICWPLDFVYSKAKPVGFIMPLSFKGSHSLYDIYLTDENHVFDRRTKEGVENRLKLLYNIANAINILHVAGYALVDFKPQNILFTDSGQISMIDMDSIQISKKNQLLFPATAYTIEYAYPKELHCIGQNRVITSRWDCYSFSIVAYQMLFGVHPFTASTEKKDKYGNDISGLADLMINNMFPFGPRKNDIKITPIIQNYFYYLAPKLQEIFIDSFNLDEPMPDMDVWISVLLNLIQSNRFEENFFRQNPKPPIFIINEKKVVKRRGEDFLELKWSCFYCERIYINDIDVTTLTETTILIPKSREVVISFQNKFSTKEQVLSFIQESIFCIKCGCRFSAESDIYCTHCGTKRI